MKLNRIFLVGLLITLLAMTACAPATTPEPAEVTQEAEEAFRVAVIMPSAINDAAFSQSMYDALVRIQGEMGEENFQFDYSENMFVVEDASAAIRDYASQDYNLVIAHGSQYGASLQEIAPDFPETSFAWGTTVDTFGLPNIFAYEARSEEGGYVNGVMAAMFSTSGSIGVIGPIETGDAKLYVDGFAAGAAATNADADVQITYTGSFSDTSLASEAANTHIANGADALTGTAQMVVGAIGIAQEQGIPWWGTQSNQTSLAPEIVVASQVYHWEGILTEMIGLIKAGTPGGQSFEITLENGGLIIEYNEGYDLPDDVRTAADAAISGIKDGSITVDLP
jgi:basic membrane lipoprotein Med (substrate-binding protein (PBP1-ABC) superfamily)